MLGIRTAFAMCLACIFALTNGCLGPLTPILPASTKTTVIIVRHAERDPGLDPPLNEEGVARAAVLREALAERGVTAIYCTDLIRNRQTVQDLAGDLGLTPNLINPALYVDTVAAAETVVSDMLRDHPGGTILFCGNIGSVFGTPGINETIYARLGGTGRTPVRYQDLYVIEFSGDSSSNIIKAEYGEPSSLDPS